MNLIKKFLALSGALSLGASSTAIVVSCGPQNNELQILIGETRHLDLPSLDELGKIVHDRLLKKGFNKKISINPMNNFDKLASSVASGNTALGFLGTAAYYENSIKEERNTMHQLVSSTRPALLAEYNTAIGNDKAQKFKQMNINGSIFDMNVDQNNVFKLVMESSDIQRADQISVPISEEYGSDYFRGYQFINKNTLKKYYDFAINNSEYSNELKTAWKELVVIENNGKDNHAVFLKTAKDTTENLLNYWRVVWNIYEQAANDKGIGLSANDTSSSGRLNPIWTMMEVYLLAHQMDINDSENQEKAKKAVFNLLNEHIIEIKTINTDGLDFLMGAENNANRVSISPGFAGTREIYSGAAYTIPEILDETTIFSASHGIINDGIVYSTNYFKNNLDLLKSVQETFIELMKDTPAKDIIFNAVGFIGLKAIPIEDNEAIKKYEKTIYDMQTHSLRNIALDVSKSITIKGGSN